MRTQNIVKACVAAACLFAFVQSASAQEKPKTDVGQQSLLSQGANYSVWEERLPDPAPGFRAYNVWLKVNGTQAGKFVNAFQQVNITGVHQVWEQVGRNRFPTNYPDYYDGLADFIGAANAARIESYDSYVLFTKADQSNGADPSETNNAANPAGLDTSFGLGGDFTGVVGLGELGILNRAGGAPAALGLSTRNPNLGLARVVLYDGTAGTFANPAILSGSFGGEGDGNEANGGEINEFANVQIGATIVPEPAMGLMALIGSVGLLGFRRRNS